MNIIVSDKFSNLSRLLNAQLSVAPQHEKFFRRRFSLLTEQELSSIEVIAGQVSKLIQGAEAEHLVDYVWLCGEQIQEELHFRRTGKYSAANFQEAYEKVYSNAPYMQRYMNGLLMTQLWWSNHTQVMTYYQSTFLSGNKQGYTHLEIGPGHGLFLYLAAADQNCASAHGWDISEASIALTLTALKRLDTAKLPKLELVDLFKGPSGAFDSIVFSEVLEHMDRPREALQLIRNLLAPKGRLFINMPINSPAPDHLFNTDTVQELASFVEAAGFKIVNQAVFPATNQTLAQAEKKKLTISCAFIAETA